MYRMNNIPNIDGLFPKKTQEEVQAALDGFISSLEGEDSEVIVDGTTTKTNNAVPDVVSAFNELVGN